MGDQKHKFKRTHWSLKALSLALYNIPKVSLMEFKYAVFYVEGKDFISDEDFAKLFEQAGIDPKQFFPDLDPAKYAIPLLE